MHPARLFLLLSLVCAITAAGSLSAAHAQMRMPPHSLEEVIETASGAGTPILVEIYAPWCPYCQRMQKNVYSDSTVRDYLSNHFTYARLNSDTTAGTHQYANRTLSSKQLASALGARGVPTTVFMKPDGTPIARQPGFIDRPTFLKMIRYVGSGAYQQQSFQEFTGPQSK